MLKFEFRKPFHDLIRRIRATWAVWPEFL